MEHVIPVDDDLQCEEDALSATLSDRLGEHVLHPAFGAITTFAEAVAGET